MRVCRQHGIALFYHLTAGQPMEPEPRIWRSARERARDWRCVDCGRIGTLPPWITSARDGFAA